MKDIKNKQVFILDYLSHECTSDSLEYSAENTGSVLSPQEVAAKIWEQWMRCRLLSVELKSEYEKIG